MVSYLLNLILVFVFEYRDWYWIEKVIGIYFFSNSVVIFTVSGKGGKM